MGLSGEEVFAAVTYVSCCKSGGCQASSASRSPREGHLDPLAPGDCKRASRPFISPFPPFPSSAPPPHLLGPVLGIGDRGHGDYLANSPSLWLPGLSGRQTCQQPATSQHEGIPGGYRNPPPAPRRERLALHGVTVLPHNLPHLYSHDLTESSPQLYETGIIIHFTE